MQPDFTGQVAVVTGAARGFGLAFARAFAERGASVYLTDVDWVEGEHAAESGRADGYRLRFLPLDVTDAEAVESVVKTVVDDAGQLDIWVNNAGLALHGASETLPIAHWQRSMNILLSGTFYGAQAAGRHMLAQEQGVIINIASVNGLVAQAGRAAYCAAKAGVIRLTEVLAAEWAGRGVRVNAIAPAVILTDLARASIADGSASMDVYLERSPTGRLGEVDDVVHALLFLASPQAAYIHGQTLRVDGAWVADHML